MHWRYSRIPHHHLLHHHINSRMVLGKLASFQPIKTETIHFILSCRNKPAPITPLSLKNKRITYSNQVKKTSISLCKRHSSLITHIQCHQILTLLSPLPSYSSMIHQYRKSSTCCLFIILPIFDYCNFTFHLIPNVYIARIHTLQNSIVGYIYQINKFSHTNIMQYLIKLYWLPIKSSCIYKIALLAHKSIHHYIPDYLSHHH